MLPMGRNLFRLLIGPEIDGRTGACADSAPVPRGWERTATGMPDLGQDPERTTHTEAAPT